MEELGGWTFRRLLPDDDEGMTIGLFFLVADDAAPATPDNPAGCFLVDFRSTLRRWNVDGVISKIELFRAKADISMTTIHYSIFDIHYLLFTIRYLLLILLMIQKLELYLYLTMNS